MELIAWLDPDGATTDATHLGMGVRVDLAPAVVSPVALDLKVRADLFTIALNELRGEPSSPAPHPTRPIRRPG